MSEFAPSIDAAKSALGAATPIDVRAHPGGAAGAKVSLDEVAARVRKGRLDPRVRAWAIRSIKEAGEPRTVQGQAQALLDALRKATTYVQDPINAEFMQAAAETLCLDDKGLCFKGGDCFPKGTLLLRDDYKLVPIEDIKPGDRIWGYDKWTRVEGKKFKGVLPVDAVILNNGSAVQLTKDHKVYVAYCDRHANRSEDTPGCGCSLEERRIERVCVSELRSKDVVLQPKRLPFGAESLDVDRAYVEGLYVADGWCEDYRFSISGQDGQPKEEQKREVKAICERLGIETYWHRKHIRVKDSEWTLRMQEMGLHAPEKHLLSINLDEAAAAATLRGVLADSGENAGGGSTFTTTSHELFTQTRVLLRMFGKACSSRYVVKHGGLGKNPIWRLGIRDPKEKAEKILRVKEVERAIDEVACYDIQTEDHFVYLPEHDITVSNCDDLVIAYGSAASSIGIPTKVVGQSFDASGVPTHVIAAVQDIKSGTWYRVDPSSKYDVGSYFPATKEVWIDPMSGGEGEVGMMGGEFVGVGRPPVDWDLGLAGPPLGLGDYTEAERRAIFDGATTSLQTAVFKLQSSLIDLRTSKDQANQMRLILNPENPFDPEPASPIKDVSDFLSGGAWTLSMSNVCDRLIDLGLKLTSAGQEALNGARRILVDNATRDAYLEATDQDPWHLHAVLRTSTDSILAFLEKPSSISPTLIAFATVALAPFSPLIPLALAVGTFTDGYQYLFSYKDKQIDVRRIVGGFSSKSGQALSPQEVQARVQSAQTTGVQGRGLGIAPVVIAIIAAASVVSIALVSIATYYIVAKLCDQATAAAKEATSQAVMQCITSGKCTVEQGKTLLQTLSDNRVAETKAEEEKNKADPFANALGSLGKMVTWLVIGGVVITGVVIGAPLIKEGVSELTEWAKARRQQLKAERERKSLPPPAPRSLPPISPPPRRAPARTLPGIAPLPTAAEGYFQNPRPRRARRRHA